ncbi:cold-shock protein [Mesorhizobium sp. 2RAF21]|uniref:cold-shock protein n=1 Tax=Mesorhizobium sp. 2RAF21 TaxID=3232995 RepID=UPI003F986614
MVAEPADAEVLWFNSTKGFGFVKLADGSEAYMHMRALEAAGSREVAEGTRLKVTIEEMPKGRQVAQVLEIGEAVLKSPSHGGRRGAIAAGTDPELKTEGTVKWYNSEKGFGFIAPSNGDPDIFVHATALTRSGLRGLVDGQKVVVECGQGKKDLEVRTIRLDG